MKLTVTTCYSHILHLMMQGENYSLAINDMKMSTPGHTHEGITGYIETNVEFQIRDLALFSKLWYSWYNLEDDVRNTLYTMAKGGFGKCK